MNKTSKRIIALALSVVTISSTFAACASKKDEEGTITDTPETQIRTETITVTEYVPVTDENGEQQTNANGEAQTEVVTKVETTEIIETVTQTETTRKNSGKDKTTTTTRPNKTTTTTTTRPSVTLPKPPTTTRPVKPPVTTTRPPTTTNPPTTTKPANPYKYDNAWNTIPKMEADMKDYVESIGGTYQSNDTLETGCWVTPMSGEGFKSPNAFKERIKESIDYRITEQGYKKVRVIFVTKDNCFDGRCGDAAAEIYQNEFVPSFVHPYDCDNRILAYIVFQVV